MSASLHPGEERLKKGASVTTSVPCPGVEGGKMSQDADKEATS